MDGIFSELDKMRDIVNRKASENRDSRDELNKNVSGFLNTRNDFNRQVRELIEEVQRQKVIRDEANGLVRDAKSERTAKNQGVRDAKEKLRELSPKQESPSGHSGGRGKRDRPDTPASIRRQLEKLEDDFSLGKFVGKNEKKYNDKVKELKSKLRKLTETEDSNVELKEARENLRQAIEEQEVAHQALIGAAEEAQGAHDLMLKLSEEVDRLREKADSSQAQVRRVKREADTAHQSYIVSLRCLHSIDDIKRAKKNKDEGIDTRGGHAPVRVETEDLMKKLMAGETLSTDELMALQRGS